MDMSTMFPFISSTPEGPCQDVSRLTEATFSPYPQTSTNFYQPWNYYTAYMSSMSRAGHYIPSPSTSSYSSSATRDPQVPSSSSSSLDVTQLSSSGIISQMSSSLTSSSTSPSPVQCPSSTSKPSPSSSPLQSPLPRSTELHLPSSISSLSSSPAPYLYQAPASSSSSYPSSSPSSYKTTPDKEARNMNDSGNSTGLSSDSSPLSQSSDISLPTTSPTSSPVLPNPASSSPDETRVKKNSRTNYSPKQVRCLEKIFLETPYPEPELMEQLSRDLGIPEKNLKIWFQNKRARWRKRVQNNKPTFPPVYPCYPAPVPSTVSAYSLMSPSSLMSPVVAPQVASRSVYDLPSTTSTPVNKPTHQLYPSQFSSYTYPPYMLPHY